MCENQKKKKWRGKSKQTPASCVNVKATSNDQVIIARAAYRRKHTGIVRGISLRHQASNATSVNQTHELHICRATRTALNRVA